ncbi:MAG: adenylate/guanylate cyclase domain-containing protein [Candidatus Electrothrix sp. GW3-4]|uniref:adenylate/guanylate cyclase domain-containing protein n=1 Tax=Candidatus Electrothrix sp. GW3-4 TaxID=3126740 RepID=UPI0030D1E298
MRVDSQYEIKNQKWLPCFASPRVERQFMRGFNLEALTAGRVGFFIVSIVWVGFFWFDLQMHEPQRSSALFFRFFIGAPLLFLVLAALYSKYAVTRYQLIITFGIIIIESSIFWIVIMIDDFKAICDSMGLELPLQDADGRALFVFTWLLVIFMGSMLVRLNILQSVFNGLVVVFLNALTVKYCQPTMILIIISIPFLLATLAVVWASSLHLQQMTRQNFRITKLLAQSMNESENLLLNILPAQIADRLKATPGTIADGFNNVSVLFADIVGFTVLSEKYRPDVLVNLLNNIFSDFDKISEKYGAEKIKTIGDAYMLAAGIPKAKDDHYSIVAHCALHMLQAVKKFTDPEGNPIRIRIGIHTGPAIAGVIGTRKFSYDLWGDTVNTASRMESHGNADKIQMTKEMADKLRRDFLIEPRNAIEVKGKGKMQTFWLIGPR